MRGESDRLQNGRLQRYVLSDLDSALRNGRGCIQVFISECWFAMFSGVTDGSC